MEDELKTVKELEERLSEITKILDDEESENFCPHCSCLIIEEDAKWGRCPKCYNEYGE